MASWCSEGTEVHENKLLSSALDELKNVKFKIIDVKLIDACFRYHASLVNHIETLKLDGDRHTNRQG